MFKKLPAFIAILFILLPQVFLGGHISLAAANPRVFNERFVVRTLVDIHGAQATYQAVNGNGNFGSLANLYSAGLIGSALATGNKYGYSFVMSVTSNTAGTLSRFNITATPQRYSKTGRRSFYQDETAEVRGGDKNGDLATFADLIIDTCPAAEVCAIQALRTLHGAEYTYQATSGYPNFGSLSQLAGLSLIRASWASGSVSGYNFTVTFVSQTPTVPASFKISAVPQTYGTTGIRSFFIGENGVIHGADKNGLPADENDPPLNQ